MSKDMNKNIILIDWFAVTFRKPGVTPFDIIDMLDFKYQIDFKEFPGRYYYRNRLSFGNIHIYYNHYVKEQDFPLLEMTGQGCREFETFSNISFDDLFELVKDTSKFHMVRLDIAFDDHTGIFDITKIMDDYFKRNWVSKSVKGTLTDDVTRNIDGFSLMTGKKSSDIYMRIYDKAVERGYKDGRHWIRCELILKQDRAINFVLDNESLGKKFRGVIKNYFRFVTPNPNDTNKRRWKNRKYWDKFLSDSEKISLYTPKDVDYNLHRLNRYVFGQAGNSIDTYIKCVGLVRFLDDLVNRDSKLNAKQKYLIEQSKSLIQMNIPVTSDVLEKLEHDYKT